jgi:type 1 fimbria pilin
MTPVTDLADRYGRTPRPRRGLSLPALVAIVVAVPFLTWLAWVIWVYSTPSVQSEMESFSIPDPHRAVAVINVTLSDDAVDPTCRITAAATDKTTVGDQSFTPADGRNRVEIRTEREATSVELIGCTAADQPHPR